MPRPSASATAAYSAACCGAPGRIGIAIDARGGGGCAAGGARAHGRPLTAARLRKFGDRNGKWRYAFDTDGHRLRAVEGRWIDVGLGLPPLASPARHYHGTAMRTLDVVLREGLSPRTRRHVHLRGAPATAGVVGTCRGRPAVLEVHAEVVDASGRGFFDADNGVRPTACVPPVFLALLDAAPAVA